VTQLVAKGNPRLWSLGNPFSPYCCRLSRGCRVPYSLPPSYPTSYRSRTLYLAYTCRCSMNSPRRLSLSLSRFLSLSLLLSLSLTHSLTLFLLLPPPCRSVRRDVTLTPSEAFADAASCDATRSNDTPAGFTLLFSLAAHHQDFSF